MHILEKVRGFVVWGQCLKQDHNLAKITGKVYQLLGEVYTNVVIMDHDYHLLNSLVDWEMTDGPTSL